MEYLLHYVKFEMWRAFGPFSIFFPTLKLKLGHNFPHSSTDSELGLRNLGLRLYFQVLTIHKEIEQFTFPNIWKRLKVGIFYCKSSPLLSYFVILYLGRVGQPIFIMKRFSLILLGLHCCHHHNPLLPPPAVLGMNHTCSCLTSLRFFLMPNNIFQIIDQIVFTSGIDLDQIFASGTKT